MRLQQTVMSCNLSELALHAGWLLLVSVDILFEIVLKPLK